MTDLKTFSNSQFGKIRVLNIEDKPYCCAADVAKALGYKNPRDAVSRHCKGVVKRDTPTSSGVQPISYIPESDLYRLTFSSKLPGAENFTSWVVEEVLPDIRKHGTYMTPETIKKVLADPDTVIALALQLKGEQEKVRSEQQKRVALESKIEADKPHTLLGAAIASTNSVIKIGDLAKIIKQNGVDIGQNRLYKWLRKHGYLMTQGKDHNYPTQLAMNLGLFRVIEHSVNYDGVEHVSFITKVTGKGQAYFVNKLLAEQPEDKDF